MKIAFLGAGNMGSAIIAKMAKQGIDGIEIHATDHNADKLLRLQKDYAAVVHTDCAEWLQDMDAVVLAVKPQQLPQLLSSIKQWIQKALIISIAAGVRVADLEKMTGNGRICRVMPNTPVKVGLGVCGIYLSASAAADQPLVSQVFSPCGQCIWLDEESKIESLTAISGSGPAYVFLFLKALEQAGLKYGFTAEQARLMAIYTVWGSAELADQSGTAFEALCKAVQSKGGTTIEACKVIEGSGFEAMMMEAMDACRARAVELGNEFSAKIG